MKNKYRGFVAAAIVIVVGCIFTILGTSVFSAGKVKIDCFVYDPCGGCFSDNIPCKPCKVVLETESFLFGIVDQLKIEEQVDVRVYNTLYTSQKELLESKIGPGDSVEYPVLIVNNSVIYGWNSIKAEISDVLCEATGQKKTVANESGVYSEKTTEQPTLIYFGMEDCGSCKKTEEYFDNRNIYNKNCNIQTYNLKDMDSITLFKEYCKSYNVNYEDAGAPMIFIGNTALEGFEEIETFLESYIERGYGNTTLLITKKAEHKVVDNT